MAGLVSQDTEFFQVVFASIHEYAIFTADLNGHITTWNIGAEKILGYRDEEILGKPCDLIFTPEDRASGAPELERITAIRNGRAEDRRWHLRKDGSRFWGTGHMMTLHEGGEIIGFVKVLHDETAQKRLQEQREMLVNELNHRVKNTLATVQSIAAQTLRSGGVSKDIREILEARLASLSEAHNVLTRESWQGAGISEIVQSALAPHMANGAGSRIEVRGADVWVPPRVALGVAMALHELSTNAAKYGALSVPGGRVLMTWEIERPVGQRCLRMQWTESGGPEVTAPSTRGFGSRLIETGLPRELGGRVSLEFPPEGVRCEILAGLDDVLPGDGADPGGR